MNICILKKSNICKIAYSLLKSTPHDVNLFFFFLVCYIYIYHNSKTVENRTVENGTVKSILPSCYKLLNLRYNVYLNFFKIYSVLYFYGESIMRFFLLTKNP